jgi:hypothetical protein
MTRTTQEPAIEIIAIAPTTEGFSIAILRLRGHQVFVIARVNSDDQFIVLHRTPDREEARQLAKREWRGDMGR